MKIQVQRQRVGPVNSPDDLVVLSVVGVPGNAQQSVAHLAAHIRLKLSAARRLARQLDALTRR